MKYFSLLIKPAGPDCNLDCRYCFYANKSNMFGGSKHRMSEQTLEKLIKDYLALGFAENGFAWQGGEPTLMGLDFYKKAVELQKKYSTGGQRVSNTLQTNSILLDEKWCSFLHDNQFLVGISLDGPEKYHDYYRLDHSGKGTFERVTAAVENCRRHKVEYNILVLLNNKNVLAADELFDFFIANKTKYLQFIPCVEKDVKTGKIADFSVTPAQYSDFIIRIFDRWNDYGPKKLSIRLFDSMLNFIVNGQSTNCTFGRKCDGYMVIEHNGDAFCCDFFVADEYRLGNILETPIEQVFLSETKKQFADYKSRINDKCIVCRHNAVCRGGCLKDRIIVSYDFKNQSYFCPAYKKIFDYCMPKLSKLACEIIY